MLPLKPLCRGTKCSSEKGILESISRCRDVVGMRQQGFHCAACAGTTVAWSASEPSLQPELIPEPLWPKGAGGLDRTDTLLGSKGTAASPDLSSK